MDELEAVGDRSVKNSPNGVHREIEKISAQISDPGERFILSHLSTEFLAPAEERWGEMVDALRSIVTKRSCNTKIINELKGHGVSEARAVAVPASNKDVISAVMALLEVYKVLGEGGDNNKDKSMGEVIIDGWSDVVD